MVKQLDRESGMPLYLQLKENLKDYIKANFSPGDMIPIESEIEEMYQVSRMTVRKAIDELVDEQIVMKQQGRGTFVQSPKITQDMSRIFSWTEEMQQLGKQTETRGLEIQEVRPSRKLVQQLQLAANEKLVSIKRIRYANGEPIAVMINYLRASYIPGFVETGLESESLYDDLEKKYGIRFSDAEEIVSAREATDLEALALRIEQYSPVMHVVRTSYLADGKPIEVVDLVARADRYQYSIRLSGNSRSRSL
ncbi:GntR family transcriptional regulator [Paenibacillus eucommiae]|uniref:GntR family transcriptional regulator n=1 Tax=Paenibacillus eucommiae TaxID=1355755 RepID=A0ABS4IVI4_9BACL|nr:GntR family transcriptional regulator [Paenibacillus eucommiae]MBP1991090.1 GntR family transcriptional regulator [Paenibacillus eucommiae]